MTNEKAFDIVFGAAERMARHCEKGSTISFNNDFDEQEAELIREAIAHLTQRAVDFANVAADGLSLHNFLVEKDSGLR
jgi:hypothetical protein